MDISNLQKSAINFLYIFVAENASVSADIKRKRAEQLDQLAKIYRKNTGYTFKQLVEIVQNGIIQRYGKSPEQLLQNIYSVAVKPTSISGPEDDILSAQQVEAISTTVDTGSGKTEKNIWKDIKDVIEWLVALLQKIFGTYTDPNIYSPKSKDWTYGNRPTYIEGSASNTAGMTGILPVVAAGAIVYYLYSSTKKKPSKRK